MFDGCTDLSYRKTTRQLNQVRQQTGATRVRTLNNAAEHEAGAVEQHLRDRAAELLSPTHFDGEGRPTFHLEPEASATGLLPPSEVVGAIGQCVRDDTGADISVEELAANPIPYENPKRTTAASIDDVGVKKQKPRRKAAPRESPAKKGKEKKRVWTTVAHVQHAGASYTLTATSVPAVLRLLSALLVASGLRKSALVFFTDGQRSLKDSIFAFWWARGRVRLILDWYHLQHKCKELGSFGLKGSIADKKVHIRALRRLLWHGLVDRAKAYVEALPHEAVRRPEVLERINGYLERNRQHIPCYAARAKLGLRCSSNPVEKQNDVVVAHRQKKNGMAWSEDGSHALATLAAVRRNGETDNWLRTGRLDFKIPKAA